MIKQISKTKYRFVVNVGSGDSRKRYTKTITHKGGKKELQKLYERFEGECRKNPLTDITVEELMDSYIAYSKSLGRKQTTLSGYRIAQKRFSDSLKRVYAQKVTPYLLEKEIALWVDKSLSAKSIKNSIGLLSAAYEHAVHTGQLDSNPCKRVTLPKYEKKEILTFSREDIQAFLFAIADVLIDEKVAYELALFMGLRRSEIIGLKKSDVDLMHGVLYIHNTRHRVDGEDYESDTKTKRSRRVLAIPDILIMDIGRLLQSHSQFKYEMTDYLITDGFGNPLGGQALTSRLRRLEIKNNLPLVTIHGLRHTYATLLNASGVDMARISAELGHSNVTTTANIYTHVFGNVSQSSVDISKVINRFNEENEVQNDIQKEQNESSATNLPHEGNKKR